MKQTNTAHAVWNQALVSAGTHYIYVPNDFSDFDEVWYDIMIHGTNGTPTTGIITATWQISHYQSGGGYHDEDQIWQDLSYIDNSHLYHSGLDWPLKLARTVAAAFSPALQYIRGIRLATGRVRLKINIGFTGGTDPTYTMSLSVFARSATSDTTPTTHIKALSANDTLYDYVRDVWGYTVRNKDSALAKVLFKNTNTASVPYIAEHLGADEAVTNFFVRPVRFSGGVYLNMILGGENGIDVVIHTTDNVTY